MKVDYMTGWEKDGYESFKALHERRGWAIAICKKKSHFPFIGKSPELRIALVDQYHKAILRFKAMPQLPLP